MSRLVEQFIALAAFTALGAAGSLISGLSPKPWEEPAILPGQIEINVAKALDVIWLDARTHEDFVKSHIPDALFYDQAAPADNLANLFPIWIENPRPIIVYCADEGCGTSEKVAEFLRENLPEAEIYTLKGGWISWRK